MIVTTWNLLGRRQRHIDWVADYLLETGSDVIGLQEVSPRQFRKLREKLNGYSGQWTFKHWSILAPGEGLALFTKLPVRHFEHFQLPSTSNPFSYHRRVAQMCKLSVNNNEVNFVNTHLSTGDDGGRRIQQAKLILDRSGSPIVFAGDLNEHPSSQLEGVFKNAGLTDSWGAAGNGEGATNWSGPRDVVPTQRIDYIWTSLKPVSAEVPNTETESGSRFRQISDHLPLVVELATN